jgi:hypothetical protein
MHIRAAQQSLGESHDCPTFLQDEGEPQPATANIKRTITAQRAPIFASNRNPPAEKTQPVRLRCMKCVRSCGHRNREKLVLVTRISMRYALLACLLAACGHGPGATTDAGSPGDGAMPLARCDRPALYDVSSPTAIVGNGSAASCTAAALQQAASGGGTIVFNCGSSPVTITVTSQITFTKETVLDGGGLVTLSGGGASRILYLDSAYDTPTPRLVVQRLTFRDGKSPAVGADTAQGGAAIYRDGGSLTVLDSVFENNHGPATGQDVAGGAIYGFGGGDTIVVGSTFTRPAMAAPSAASTATSRSSTARSPTTRPPAAAATRATAAVAARCTWMAARKRRRCAA